MRARTYYTSMHVWQYPRRLPAGGWYGVGESDARVRIPEGTHILWVSARSLCNICSIRNGLCVMSLRVCVCAECVVRLLLGRIIRHHLSPAHRRHGQQPTTSPATATTHCCCRASERPALPNNLPYPFIWPPQIHRHNGITDVNRWWMLCACELYVRLCHKPGMLALARRTRQIIIWTALSEHVFRPQHSCVCVCRNIVFDYIHMYLRCGFRCVREDCLSHSML